MDRKTLKSKFTEFLDKIGEASYYSNGYYTDIHNYYDFPIKDVSKYSTKDDKKDVY